MIQAWLLQRIISTWSRPSIRAAHRLASSQASATTGSTSASTCAVNYTITPQNSSTFGATVAIKNNGTTTSEQLDTGLELCQWANDQQLLERGRYANRRQCHGNRTARPVMGEHSCRWKLHRVRVQRHLERYYQLGTGGILGQRNRLHGQLTPFAEGGPVDQGLCLVHRFFGGRIRIACSDLPGHSRCGDASGWPVRCLRS